MIDKATLWKDLTTQLTHWIKGGFVPNMGQKMFATGFGGPGKENETTSPADFFAVRDDWKNLSTTGAVAGLCLTLGHTFALPKPDKGSNSLGFVVNQSQSGYTSSSTCDFVCKLDNSYPAPGKGNFTSTDTKKTFAYHINIPGIKECGG